MSPHTHSGNTPYEVASIGDELSTKVCVYLALSAHDSLGLAPFNQPALELVKEGFRVISITIPGHEPPLRKENAMDYWTEQLSSGNDLLSPFFSFVASYIDSFDFPVSIMGLSRGGFCALHTASLTSNISHIVLFAPLLSTSHFDAPLDLSMIAKTSIFVAIGNNDRRVGTKNTLTLYESIVEKGVSTQKTLPYTLSINPSIGYMGHGTSPNTFKEGTKWLARGIHQQ